MVDLGVIAAAIGLLIATAAGLMIAATISVPTC